MSDIRNEAEQYLRHGVGSIAAAFALQGSRRWQFDMTTRERAADMLKELVGLFHHTDIAADPRTEAAEASAKDVTFQCFLRSVMTTSRRKKSRETRHHDRGPSHA